MSADEPKEGQSRKTSRPNKESSKPAPSTQSSWFQLPPYLRTIFDTFPLLVYEDNQLPQRACSKLRSENVLHIFTLRDSSDATNLSFNPACLKWQAYLLANGVPFTVLPSNNHASPTGALPFVLPARRLNKDLQPQGIGASKIMRWAESQGAGEEQLDITSEAYMSLIEQNVRNAWLYCLYLQPENFTAVATTLYISPSSSNPFVQATLAHQLQAAAKEQLRRWRPYIDADEIYEGADAAFRSLQTRLGTKTFFTGSEKPGLLDFSLFAYSHVLLDLATGGDNGACWVDKSLLNILRRYEGLLDHRNNVLDCCTGP